MEASIAEVVRLTCEPPRVQATPSDREAPPEPSQRLLSIHRLTREIAAHQRSLAELQETRTSEERSLREAKVELRALKARIQGLELGLAQKDQAAFVLLNTLDRMQMIYARVAERAQRVAMRTSVTAPCAAAPEPETHQAVPTVTEKRASTRTPVVAEVGITTDTNFYSGFTQDISKGGLFIATPDTLPIGTRFLLDCKLPESPEIIRCMVEVAWVREYHEGMSYELGAVPGMGVKFIGLTADNAAAIAAFQATRETLFFPDGSEGC